MKKKIVTALLITAMTASVFAGCGNRMEGDGKVQAMADEVEEKLGQAGYTPRQVEGYQTANWILMDYQDIIIHIFDEENRLFYDLERIWRDGNLVEKVDLEA